ncbi:MAG: AI-2E family transporter [Chloroflexi bacterium]|nr:MAG: AI-2E family transporter [Chloroflexota bacterium]
MRYWVAFALLLLLLYAVRSILPPFVVAVALAYILVPLVDWLHQRFKIPRILSILGLYFSAFALVAAGILAIEPTLSTESRELGQNAPQIVEQFFRDAFGGDQIVAFGQTLRPQTIAAEIVRSVEEKLLRSVFDVLLFLIVLFYLLMDWDKIGVLALTMLPADSRHRVREVADRIHKILARYVRGELVLIALMAAVTYIFLAFVFHLHFALAISIATGFLEVIPLVGPAIAATLAAVVGFSQGGGQLALWIVVFYTVARHVEDYLVVPNVVGRAVHLHPIITLFAVLAGGALAGVLGMVLAVPTAAALVAVWDVVRRVGTEEAPAHASQPVTRARARDAEG